jgi:hypothetical protein
MTAKVWAWLRGKWYSHEYRWLRFWWERRTRGFDESELWCLNSHIVDFLLPRLRAFREGAPDIPSHLFFEERGMSDETYHRLPKQEKQRIISKAQARWKLILTKIVVALELFVEHDGCIPHRSQREFEEGWKFFHDYFFDLWW